MITIRVMTTGMVMIGTEFANSTFNWMGQSLVKRLHVADGWEGVEKKWARETPIDGYFASHSNARQIYRGKIDTLSLSTGNSPATLKPNVELRCKHLSRRTSDLCLACDIRAPSQPSFPSIPLLT